MTQQSLFNAQAQAEKDETLMQQINAEIAVLEERIKKGEAWLAANPPENPRHKANHALYWALIEERDKKLCILENRRELKCCILQLPSTARYQPTGSSEVYDTLRVLFSGEPVAPNEITIDGMIDYMWTVGWLKEVMRE